ncbi:uncharacterized protein LOC116305741 [Actinia tenebrosa]|uniref:Uncharacterized protein LOC116305741 n=1 Tax=Actinia tenebrosa TaxID=6105 RepID=A0A6P8IWS2_ACTTE|nr:uncharacterized protein LOC116305741 [Actinia tenebrosa]
MKAGLYIPYDNPSDLAQMTVTKCTKYCCKKPGIIDIVFLLNKYCYCVSCYSVKLCRLFSIDPPEGFHPVAVVLNKDIVATLVSPTSSQRRPNPWMSGSGRVFTNHLFTKKLSPTKLSVSTRHVWNAATRFGREREERRQSTTNKVTLPPIPVPTSFPTSLRPTRIAIKERTVEGKGNEDISIQCLGTFKITRVLAFGIVGDTKTVTDFDRYCQANIKDVDNAKICIISLKRVYKTNYPPFISTKVTYKCTYFTRN